MGWRKPKFGINWSNTLTHDDANLLFHADEDFLTFFQENQKKLENSFIILVGDHGMRFGSVSQTTLGKREIKNPLLQITVPKFLRENKELMRNLYENAQRLVTHYDIYATLNDILNFGLPSNFTDFSEKEVLEKNENNGTSLLRPFSEKYQKRTCRNIPIDTSYCLCEYEKKEITDKKLGKAAGARF
ncbi:unnamed protein product, partial [Mesorhabditis belari]|uniref:Sulfatase N-terminal domain-containing protein n=1 Tax=Mesorhabditis belari TaxID=2138241 RepID=A0AAF3J3A1_9BILA